MGVFFLRLCCRCVPGGCQGNEIWRSRCFHICSCWYDQSYKTPSLPLTITICFIHYFVGADASPLPSHYFIISAALGDLCNYARAQLQALGEIYGLYESHDITPKLQECSNLHTPTVSTHESAEQKKQEDNVEEDVAKGKEKQESEKASCSKALLLTLPARMSLTSRYCRVYRVLQTLTFFVH